MSTTTCRSRCSCTMQPADAQTHHPDENDSKRMSLSDRRSFERLACQLEPGSRYIRHWRLSGGVSARVTAFELETRDGRIEKLVVREHGELDRSRNRGIAADEYRLLNLLHAAGLPVARPRQLDERGEFFSTPCLVLDYIDGQPPGATDPAAVTEQLARVLAHIHRIRPARTDLSFLPVRTEPPELKRSQRSPRNDPVLLHGDFWPGNTLWRDGELVAVIDWEDAANRDPLADVANARLELLWTHDDAGATDFTHRYASAAEPVDFANLPAWDIWAHRRLVERIGSWGLDEATERMMKEKGDRFRAEARGKLTRSITNPPGTDCDAYQ